MSATTWPAISSCRESRVTQSVSLAATMLINCHFLVSSSMSKKRQTPKPKITIAKYKRYWAVYVDGELLCVTVYRKGAEKVKAVLEEREPYNKRMNCD